MDLNNNDGDKLFEQRNESSVLFSLDSLAQVSESSSESEHGFGGSGDESGLIDLNTLTQMGSSDQSTDDFAGGAPVFNSVKSKKEKKKSMGLIIGVILAFLIVAGIAGYYVWSLQGEKQAADDKAAAEMAELKAQLDKANQDAAAAKAQAEQLEADKKERELTAEEQAKLDEALRIAAEAEAKKKAAEAEVEAAKNGGTKKDKPKVDTKSGDGGTPVAQKPAGSKKGLTADQVKGPLTAAAPEVAKCAKNGNLVVSFSVSPAGKATGITAVSGSFKGTPTEKCIITKVSKIKFAESGSGASGVKWNFKL